MKEMGDLAVLVTDSAGFIAPNRNASHRIAPSPMRHEWEKGKGMRATARRLLSPKP